MGEVVGLEDEAFRLRHQQLDLETLESWVKIYRIWLDDPGLTQPWVRLYQVRLKVLTALVESHGD